MQDVLFESKLAGMCLTPKVVDEAYLKPHELAFLRKHVPEAAARDSPSALVFTHPYDSVRCFLVIRLENWLLCGVHVTCTVLC